MTTTFNFSSGQVIAETEERRYAIPAAEEQQSLRLVPADAPNQCSHTMPPELFELPVDTFLWSQE